MPKFDHPTHGPCHTIADKGRVAVYIRESDGSAWCCSHERMAELLAVPVIAQPVVNAAKRTATRRFVGLVKVR